MITRHSGGMRALHRNLTASRGVGFIWFCLIALPVVFFSAGLSVDLTRIIVANREASNLATAAAIAGAYEFEPGQTYLSPGRARTEAAATWQFGSDSSSGNVRNAVPLLDPGSSVRVQFNNASRPTSVTVAVDYRISGLLFTSFFGQSSAVDRTLSRTANVCVPGERGNPTSGFCTRPTT